LVRWKWKDSGKTCGGLFKFTTLTSALRDWGNPRKISVRIVGIPTQQFPIINQNRTAVGGGGLDHFVFLLSYGFGSFKKKSCKNKSTSFALSACLPVSLSDYPFAPFLATREPLQIYAWKLYWESMESVHKSQFWWNLDNINRTIYVFCVHMSIDTKIISRRSSREKWNTFRR
jgi:hypothetical protein